MNQFSGNQTPIADLLKEKGEGFGTSIGISNGNSNSNGSNKKKIKRPINDDEEYQTSSQDLSSSTSLSFITSPLKKANTNNEGSKSSSQIVDLTIEE